MLSGSSSGPVPLPKFFQSGSIKFERVSSYTNNVVLCDCTDLAQNVNVNYVAKTGFYFCYI